MFYFTKEIEFGDGSKEIVEFECEIIESGFHFTRGMEKGFQKELEVDNMMVISPLDDKSLEYVEDKIAEREYDNYAIEKYLSEVST